MTMLHDPKIGHIITCNADNYYLSQIIYFDL
jgi:uncharacterized protein YifN (PemK superfamily)